MYFISKSDIDNKINVNLNNNNALTNYYRFHLTKLIGRSFKDQELCDNISSCFLAETVILHREPNYFPTKISLSSHQTNISQLKHGYL